MRTAEFRPEENKGYFYDGKELLATLDFNKDVFECFNEDVSEDEQDEMYDEMTAYADDYKGEYTAVLTMGFNF